MKKKKILILCKRIEHLEDMIIMLSAAITGIALIADERFNDFSTRIKKLEQVLDEKRFRIEEHDKSS